MADTNGDLQEKIDRVLMAYRTTPSTVTGLSPAKLMFRREINTRMDCMTPSVSHTREATANTNHIHVRSLEVGDNVKIRNYTDKRKWVSGVVIRKIGTKIYQGKVNDKLVIRHIDQLLKTKCNMHANHDNWYDTIKVGLR